MTIEWKRFENFSEKVFNLYLIHLALFKPVFPLNLRKIIIGMSLELVDQFKEKEPVIVFEWNDSETEAIGWVVINSLRGGAAGGGTRMRKGLDKHEVISLAKVMEIKFSICGPPIGGAKSGINFDPADPRKEEVLKRWYQAVTPLLKSYYGTGGDLNVDEIHEVIPMTEGYGLWHPQEGVMTGHLRPSEAKKIKYIGQLRQGVSKVVEDPHYTPENGKKYVVADLITGYGVAQAVKHYYKIFKNESLKEKRAIIQGFGNVSGAAAVYLAEQGTKVVGIIDKENGLIKEDGFTLEEIKILFAQRKKNTLYAESMLSFEETNEKIWDLDAEIFVPGAASRLVTREHVEKMINTGLEVISCGANVPFADHDIFYGKTAKFADEHLAIIPDFIANSGMARAFAYLLQDNIEMTDRAIFDDVSDTIRQALKNLHEANKGKTTLMAKTALVNAVGKLL